MSTFATTTFRHIRGINRGMKSPVLQIYWQYGPVKWTFTGGGERTRTADFHVANVALYQLSYTPVAIAPGQGTRSAPRHGGRPRRSGFHDSASAGGQAVGRFVSTPAGEALRCDAELVAFG